MSCIICGSSHNEFLWRKREHNFVKCPDCGLVYVEEFERTRDVFSSESVPEYQRKLRTGLVNELSPYCRKGRLLDLGCGTGSFSASLIKRGFDVYGVDPNRTTLSYGIANFGIKGFNGYIEDAPFKEDFFDVIIMNEVIEHFSDPNFELSHCHKLLKKEGLIWIKTGASQENKDFGPEWKYCQPGEHFYFKLEHLVKLVEKNGFTVIKAQGLGARKMGGLRVWAKPLITHLKQ